MKKHVFIIGSEGGKNKRLEYDSADDILGVKQDVDFWNHLIKSSIGGCWKEDEITELFDEAGVEISKEKILNEINKKSDYDFILVYFTGHGCFRKSGRSTPRDKGVTHIFTDSGEDLDVRKLIPANCPLGLVFLDCCRSYHIRPEPLEEITMNPKFKREQNFKFEQDDSDSNFFDRFIVEQNEFFKKIIGNEQINSSQRIYLCSCNRNKKVVAGYFRGIFKSVICNIKYMIQSDLDVNGEFQNREDIIFINELYKFMIDSVKNRRKVCLDIKRSKIVEYMLKGENVFKCKSEIEKQIMDDIIGNNPLPCIRYSLLVNGKPNKELRKKFKFPGIPGKYICIDF